jgi:hypothetical protein
MKNLILALAAGVALSGCVVAPPYGAYNAAPAAVPYYDAPYTYAYPTYVGPPVSLHFGFYEHRYRGGHGWGGGYGGYRGGGGWHGRH